MGMMDGLAGFMQGTAKGVDQYRQDKRRDALVEQQGIRDDMTMKLQQLQLDMAAQNQETANRRRQALGMLNSGALQGDMGRTTQEIESKYGFDPFGYVSPEQMHYRTPGQQQQDALNLYGGKKQIDAMFPTNKNVWDVDKLGRMYNKVSGKFKEGNTPSMPVDVKSERDLRKEYSAGADYFRKIKNSFETIRSIGRDPSAAGDIGLVFSIMKMFDPGSVVRESEFATAQNAAGVPERLRAQYNRALNGQRLTPEQRKDFIGTAQRIYDDQETRYQQFRSFYSGLAKSYDMEPSRIVYDFAQDGGGAHTPGHAPGKQNDADATADALIQKYGGM